MNEPLFELTDKNYYSHEANMAYWGSTQYSDFRRCEFAGYHQYVTKKYLPEEKECFIEGNYIHTKLLRPHLFKKYVAEYYDHIYKRVGTKPNYTYEKRANYLTCDRAIETLQPKRVRNCWNPTSS